MRARFSQFARSCRTAHRGFTLIEIMMVVVIIGMIAATMLPRLGFFTEPPATLFQNSVEEAMDMALSGVSVRFVLKPTTGTSFRRGEIVVEAYKKQEIASDISSFLGTQNRNDILVWTPIQLTHPPAGKGWAMDPPMVYFFTDGSCTPARVSWAEEGASEQNTIMFYLTVTGYCAASR